MISKTKIAHELIKLLPPRNNEKWAIDGGCHIGDFSREISIELPTHKILAFEPDPVTYNSAVRNTLDLEHIEIVNSALSNTLGTAEFFRGPVSATNSLLPRPRSKQKVYYPADAILTGGLSVKTTTLDNECNIRDIKNIDLLKLDLQGGEADALAGADKILRENLINVIIIESAFVRKYQDQPLLWELWQILESYNYTIFTLTDIKIGIYDNEDPSLRQNQWNQCDAIFISKAVRKILDKSQ